MGQWDRTYAAEFVKDMASRLSSRIQLTSDGLGLYIEAAEEGFEGNVDYAQLIKLYGTDPEGHRRYSPLICTGCKKQQ